MDDILLSEPIQPGLLGLVIAPHAARPQMLALSARLGLNGPISILDAGNSYNALLVARKLRSWRCTSRQVRRILDQIVVARAFTCYQIFHLLNHTAFPPGPVLVLDILSTFHDESLPLHERRSLLQRCIRRLSILRQTSPLIISLRPPDPTQPAALDMVAQLQKGADWVLHPPPDTTPIQLSFF